MLAMAHPSVGPSLLGNGVGTPIAFISQLHTLPACTPVNASMAALRLATHDSGPGWVATPFPYDSFIHTSTPVYPGALPCPLSPVSRNRNVSGCSMPSTDALSFGPPFAISNA